MHMHARTKPSHICTHVHVHTLDDSILRSEGSGDKPRPAGPLIKPADNPRPAGCSLAALVILLLPLPPGAAAAAESVHFAASPPPPDETVTSAEPSADTFSCSLAVLLLQPAAPVAAVAAACVAASSLVGCVVRGVGVRDLPGCWPVGDSRDSSGTVAGRWSLPPLSDGLGVNRFLQQQ
jgi:hypothetical protein